MEYIPTPIKHVKDEEEERRLNKIIKKMTRTPPPLLFPIKDSKQALIDLLAEDLKISDDDDEEEYRIGRSN